MLKCYFPCLFCLFVCCLCLGPDLIIVLSLAVAVYTFLCPDVFDLPLDFLAYMFNKQQIHGCIFGGCDTSCTCPSKIKVQTTSVNFNGSVLQVHMEIQSEPPKQLFSKQPEDELTSVGYDGMFVFLCFIASALYTTAVPMHGTVLPVTSCRLCIVISPVSDLPLRSSSCYLRRSGPPLVSRDCDCLQRCSPDVFVSGVCAVRTNRLVRGHLPRISDQLCVLMS